MNRFVLIVLIAFALPVPAWAQEPPAALTKTLADLKSECDEKFEGNFTTEDGAIVPVRLRASSETDFLLDYSHVRCDKAFSLYGGSAGWMMDFFIAGERVDTLHARSWSIMDTSPPTFLWNAGGCGKLDGCDYAIQWNGKRFGKASVKAAQAAQTVLVHNPFENAGIEPHGRDYAYYEFDGSKMLVEPDEGRIRYVTPSALIANAVRPGTLFFYGDIKKNGQINGYARTHKASCLPQYYTVRGTLRDGVITLKGKRPTSAQTTCAAARKVKRENTTMVLKSMTTP